MSENEKPSSIRDCLILASPRPPPGETKQAPKKNYAERLSRALSTSIANALRPHFPGISPDKQGHQQEKRARTAKGFKKLDVNYSTPELGLGLGVSVKTIGFRDPKSDRYTKNITRVDNELRAEAVDYHKRQPYSVLAAVLFLPHDSCDDGRPPKGNGSSFAHAVNTLRFRANRQNPENDEQLFERIFIGLYEPEGDREGEIGFYDVLTPRPPKYRRPDRAKMLSFREMILEIKATYDSRNDPPFEWDTSPP